MSKIFIIAERVEGVQLIDMSKETSERKARELAEFSRRLRAAIMALGYTEDAEFGRSIGVDRANVYNWVKGNGYPSYETLIDIRRTHRISIDWLLGFSPAGMPTDLAKKVRKFYQWLCENKDLQ